MITAMMISGTNEEYNDIRDDPSYNALVHIFLAPSVVIVPVF